VNGVAAESSLTGANLLDAARRQAIESTRD